MAYLMHIGFDNSSRLCRNVYYFEYKGIRYKLIQNNIRKRADVLLTIIPDNDKELEDQAYLVASEFLSALSWHNQSRVNMWHGGGCGVPDNYQLRKAKCRGFTFPKTPFGGWIVGYDICTIPEIEAEEQKIALTLFREAFGANNNYLSFLFYWQVMGTGGTDPTVWVNKAYRKKRNRIQITKNDINRLTLNGKELGNYFKDDCRNAIAHIKRTPGKAALKLDTAEDNRRIEMSTYVVKKFAQFYIQDHLKLQKKMYLVRKNGRGFPVFIHDEDLRNHSYSIAYKRLTHAQIRKKRWH